VGQNIKEFHQGKTYERRRRRHGKQVADRQAVGGGLSGGEAGGGARPGEAPPVGAYRQLAIVRRDSQRARSSRTRN